MHEADEDEPRRWHIELNQLRPVLSDAGNSDPLDLFKINPSIAGLLVAHNSNTFNDAIAPQ